MTQKLLTGEVACIKIACSDLQKAAKQKGAGGGSNMIDNEQNLLEGLLALENRLTQLRTVAHNAVSKEIELAESCKLRIDYLKENCQRTSSSSSEGCIINLGGGGQAWQKTRLNRLLVEHFLKLGYYDSAMHLAQSDKIENLTNINIFLVAKDIEDALTRHDTSTCLTWCQNNKSKLQKINSTLEFNLRLQEFIEFIKRREKLQAVKQARKYLSTTTAKSEKCEILQKSIGLLAFDNPKTAIHRYRHFYKEDRWQFLIKQFRADNYLVLQQSRNVTDLIQLSGQSVFAAVLQSGLSALKTPRCYTHFAADRNHECPVCQSSLNQLAVPLPFANFSHSRLICYMSGKALGEHNIPMMLPNGYVYGEQALNKMARENDGIIVCPRTKEIFSVLQASKIYVL